MEVKLVGGVYQSVLSAFDQQEDLVIWLQLSVKELTEVGYLKKIFLLDFLNLQLSFGLEACTLHVVISGCLRWNWAWNYLIVYAALHILHAEDWTLRFLHEVGGWLAETGQEVDLDVLWYFSIERKPLVFWVFIFTLPLTLPSFDLCVLEESSVGLNDIIFEVF